MDYHDASRFPSLLLQPGVPMEQAREVAPGGRFVRRWTNLTVSFDCTTYSATFLSDNYDNVTIGSVLRLKTDDSSVRTPAGRDATAPARQLLEVSVSVSTSDI